MNNKDKEIIRLESELRWEKMQHLLTKIFLFLLLSLSAFLAITMHYQTKDNIPKVEITPPVPVICIAINKVTIEHWIPSTNEIVGQTSYVENITPVKCAEYLK